MLQRDLEEIVFNYIVPGKVIKIFGARRVGKTILIKQLAKRFQGKVNLLNGDDAFTEQLFSDRTVTHYKQILQDTDLLIIDEAQNIKEIGKVLKLMVDNIKTIAIIATGSSSFDLLHQTGEPLVGRSFEFILFPFSFSEYLKAHTTIEAIRKMDEWLIYGCYPELSSISNYAKKQDYLLEITSSYLLKDILMVDGIKNSSKMKDLLRLVAFQCGSIVSYDELGKQLSLSRNTVEKYLDLLTKTFVIFRLPSFFNNPRKEISKAGKWYFFDNGIRNAIINDFRPVALRNDIGILWENYVISERIKFHNNKKSNVNFYFWRTYAGQEIDLIEEQNGTISAFEMKWNEKQARCPQAFINQYPEASFQIINKNNFSQFLTNK